MKRIVAPLLMVATLLGLTSCPSSEVFVSNENSSVYYEIFVGSFYDSDGDGLGDLAGVTEKLDYLVDLGVGGVWFMPIHPSPTYHKYDVTNYYEIDDDYGTMADFEAYVASANNKNIDTILDLVINHTSYHHPWFQTALNNYSNGQCNQVDSYCSYYNFAPTYSTGYARHSNTVYYEARFWSGMPDLNLDDPLVREEITDIVSFWLAKGIKGFRLDAITSYYTDFQDKNIAFLTWLNQTIKAIKPDAYIVAEGPWGETSASVTPYYNSGIDSFFNFPVSVQSKRIYNSIRQETGKSLATFIVNHNNDLQTRNPLALDAPFLSNHDQGRSAGLMFPDLSTRDLSRKVMASAYLLMPGRPFIYYGEEIEIRGSGIDENKRLPMIWSETDKTGQTNLPIGANYDMNLQVKLGAYDQRAKTDSVLNHYRRMINLRNKYNDYIEKSSIEVRAIDPRLYGLTYTSTAGQLTIFTNLTDTAINEVLSVDEVIIDQVSPNGERAKIIKDGSVRNVKIPPFATVVIQ